MLNTNKFVSYSGKKLEELLDSFENDNSDIGQKMRIVLKRNLI